MRTVFVIDYEIEGKKGKFTVVAVMIMDAAGDMVHMTENIFGTETIRQGLVQQRKKLATHQCQKWLRAHGAKD